MQSLKRQNKLFANTICVKNIHIVGEAIKTFTFKSEIKTESNKLKQGLKYIELGTSQWSFHEIKTDSKLENS